VPTPTHLARFIVETIGKLDLGGIYQSYEPRGGIAIAPEILLGLLLYGYATGVSSSREIERASKIHANASKIHAVSHKRLGEIQGMLQSEVVELAQTGRTPDCAMVLDAVELPEEIARRQRKIDELSVAKTVLESRAQTQYELDQSAYDLRMAERAAQTVRIGRKIPSRVLQPPFYPSRTPPNTTSPIRTPES